MSVHNQHVKKVRSDAARLVAFVLFCAMLTWFITFALGQTRLTQAHEYGAIFTDVSGLETGSAVRAAGVEVGVVTDLELRDDNTVLVTLRVEDRVPLTTTTQATVRYANLTGDRYVDLTSPRGDEALRLRPGDTIPVAMTAPALDLDVLFNGFRPLTRALDPAEVNQLAESVVAISQGQGGALDELLGHTASLTTTVADRAVVIDHVIDDLTQVLGTVDEHSDDVVSLIDGLDELLTGLADDREQIGESLESLSRTTQTGAEIVEAIRPPLASVVEEAERMAAVFNSNSEAADRYLSLLPDGIRALGRGGAYGSYFNFYLCGVRFKTDGDQGPNFTPFFLSEEFRCQF